MPREAGLLRSKIEQRDFLRTAGGNFDTLRQVHRQRVRQFHLATSDRIQQQQGGKHLGDGAQFKNRVAVNLLVAAVVQLPRAKHPAAVLVQQSDDHARIALRKLIVAAVSEWHRRRHPRIVPAPQHKAGWPTPAKSNTRIELRWRHSWLLLFLAWCGMRQDHEDLVIPFPSVHAEVYGPVSCVSLPDCKSAGAVAGS